MVWDAVQQSQKCFLSLKIIEKYLNATGREGVTLVDVWEVDRETEVNGIAQIKFKAYT